MKDRERFLDPDIQDIVDEMAEWEKKEKLKEKLKEEIEQEIIAKAKEIENGTRSK